MLVLVLRLLLQGAAHGQRVQRADLFAPPHFLPAFDLSRCTYCGLCAKQCPMGAIAVDALGKMQLHRPERCIGCGLCAVACRRQQAVRMEAVPDYRLPYKSWFSYLLRGAPAMLRTSCACGANARRRRLNADPRNAGGLRAAPVGRRVELPAASCLSP